MWRNDISVVIRKKCLQIYFGTNGPIFIPFNVEKGQRDIPT